MLISFKMTKNIFIAIFTFILFFLISSANVFAISKSGVCTPNDSLTNHGCDTNLYCKPLSTDPRIGSCEQTISQSNVCDPSDQLTNHGCDTNLYCQRLPDGNGSCEKPAAQPSRAAPAQPGPFASVFGTIQAPDALKGFISKDSTGAFGISQFLSNLIALFYTVAAIVLIFMLLWGAFEWIISEGDKEKLHSAQQKIIHAIIGMVLFAVAFAIIQVLGNFTGFKFFIGQR